MLFRDPDTMGMAPGSRITCRDSHANGGSSGSGAAITHQKLPVVLTGQVPALHRALWVTGVQGSQKELNFPLSGRNEGWDLQILELPLL